VSATCAIHLHLLLRSSKVVFYHHPFMYLHDVVLAQILLHLCFRTFIAWVTNSNFSHGIVICLTTLAVGVLHYMGLYDMSVSVCVVCVCCVFCVCVRVCVCVVCVLCVYVCVLCVCACMCVCCVCVYVCVLCVYVCVCVLCVLCVCFFVCVVCVLCVCVLCVCLYVLCVCVVCVWRQRVGAS
jgi:hypothetical protein